MKISYTQLRTYKACRRLYQLKYIEGLEYNKDIDALKDGRSYHSMVEQLYKEGYFLGDKESPKINAMAFAYQKFIYPRFNVKSVEQWFEKPIGKHTLIGRVDGIADDGLIVEHKTVSGDITEEYVYNLQWDEQVLCYMIGLGVNEMYYTACKKPTIRQKQNETEEEFMLRCYQWYEEDTDSKIKFIKVKRTQEELDRFKEQLEQTIDEIENCKLFYNNVSNCTCYGRRCVYSPICLEYDASVEYIDFTKKRKEKEV